MKAHLKRVRSNSSLIKSRISVKATALLTSTTPSISLTFTATTTEGPGHRMESQVARLPLAMPLKKHGTVISPFSTPTCSWCSWSSQGTTRPLSKSKHYRTWHAVFAASSLAVGARLEDATMFVAFPMKRRLILSASKGLSRSITSRLIWTISDSNVIKCARSQLPMGAKDAWNSWARRGLKQYLVRLCRRFLSISGAAATPTWPLSWTNGPSQWRSQ